MYIHRSLFTGTGATLSPTFSAAGGRPCELLPPAITVASSTGGPSEAEGENHVEKQFRYAEHLRRQLEPTAFDFFVGHGSGGGGSLRYRSRPAGQRDSVRCGNPGEGKESILFCSSDSGGVRRKMLLSAKKSAPLSALSPLSPGGRKYS